jgi:DNA-binding CsgD family transcriptional regulator
VLHARGDQCNDFSEGRRLAAEIPGARLVTLESDNHVLLADEPAWPVFLAEIDKFLEPDRRADRALGPQRQSRPGNSGNGRSGAPSLEALESLTARERDVLRLVAAGQDNREIASTLTLSVRTVERHLQTIYRKLDLAGSAQRTAAAALLLAGDGSRLARSNGQGSPTSGSGAQVRDANPQAARRVGADVRPATSAARANRSAGRP